MAFYLFVVLLQWSVTLVLGWLVTLGFFLSCKHQKKEILLALVYHDFLFDFVHEDPKIDDDHSIFDKYKSV